MSDTSPTPTKRGLGRGLAALLGDESTDYAALDRQRSSKQVPIEQLHPGRVQPRRRFDEEALESLAESVRSQGLLQPLLVRRHPDRPAEYEIVAGERRWRAAQRAQLHEVPVVIRELSDAQALELALVENVQRQDLDAIEEAEGYRRLVEEFGHSQEELARLIGKSRPHIANTLRLLNLPEPVRDLVRDGKLTAGHARALLGVAEPAAMAEQVVRRGLSVRDTERLVAQARERPAAARPRASAGVAEAGPARPASAPAKDADTLALERDLSTLLGMKVSIELRGRGGVLALHYDDLDQLDEVLRRLNQDPARG